MQSREPPATAEGWYVLHDLRTIDWDAWREAPVHERKRAIVDGVDYLESTAAVEDAADGASAAFGVLGHKADLMLLHLRPTTADLDALERRFEHTALAPFTDRATSYVSVTEASGYSERAQAFVEGETEEDSGLASYMRSRLYPDLPDDEHVCFYPMSKRRDAEYNWYDLPFEERADLMSAHGEIGREYGGQVQQMICGSVGLDDWEWGVTLFADDPVDVKDLVYRMRFDPSSSRYAEFGPFYFGRRLAPENLEPFLAGERVAAGGGPPHETTEGDARAAAAGNGGDPEGADADPVGEAVAALGIDLADAPTDGHAVLTYSTHDVETLREEVDGLRSNFEHYDRHVLTEVAASDDRAVVVSVWTAAEAADTAAGFLADLPGVKRQRDGPLGAVADADTAGERPGGTDAGTTDSDGDDAAAGLRAELADRGVYAGQPHGEDVYALTLYSEADPGDVFEAVADLRENFEHYDTHVKTAVYEGTAGECAVVSIWETESAADTASDFLADLPGVVREADDGDGWGTMGMFYTVKPEHREDFQEKFDAVGDLLAGMDGHRETELLVNREDDTDMFIASRWDSKDDAMAFFRSDAFTDAVDWGRDVLADRPRHVFLA